MGRNFLCNFNFSVKLIFCKAFFPMGQKALQKTFAASHGKKTFAQILIFSSNWRNFAQIIRFFSSVWRNFAQIIEIVCFSHQFDENLSILSCKAFFPTGNCKGFIRQWYELANQVYLVINIKILLHDHCLGCKGFATSLGSHFIPRGFAPWDEITPSGWCKTFALHPKQWSCSSILILITK